MIGLLLLLGGNGLVSWAEQTIPSGIAALIIGAVPLFMVFNRGITPWRSKTNLAGYSRIAGWIWRHLLARWPIRDFRRWHPTEYAWHRRFVDCRYALVNWLGL